MLRQAPPGVVLSADHKNLDALRNLWRFDELFSSIAG